jgi:DNA-binding LacI/PurR family transcriptional regulator/signal transduction histidine kinase
VHRTIGVLTAQLDDAYQVEVWRGIECRSRERGVGVVCFVGQRVQAPNSVEAAANVAYRLAGPRNVEGLIVVSSAIATYLDAKGLEALFATRPRLPQVSVGLKVPGYPSVSVDGSGALGEVVRHLIRDHGRTRFAMIDGPAGHPEAADRVRAFRQALEEAGIPRDERLTAPGNFLRISGAQAARRIVAQGVPFDALVCMNDRMALGALDVLREGGIRVPEDVAVVGFDGIEEGRYVTPPLTTVTQPLRELGQGAVDALLDLMAGKPAPDRVLGGTSDLRQSCGCPPRRSYEASRTRPARGATVTERHAIRELVALAKRVDSGAFIARLNTALSQTSLDGGNPGVWHDHLSVVRNRAARRNAKAAELFEFARALIGETQSRLQAAWRVAAEERLARLRAISASLAGAFDMPVMLERLSEGLEQLSIDGGYLALFDDPAGRHGRARLLMAPHASGSRPLPPHGLRFATSSLLPQAVGSAWKRSHWVLEPLVFQTEPLGFILLPGGVGEPAVYDTLREQVASALKGALLLEQVTTHERRLEQEVLRRTAEVTRTNRELTREIERRMRLEQEVIEISNRTMQRIGQDLHDDLCQHLAGVAMHASVLRGELADMAPNAVGAVERIGVLLEESIARAKQIARGLYPAGLAEHGLAAAVEELVEAARRSYPAAIDFRATPDFHCPDTGQALQLYRIVQEALTNSLKHSGSSRIEVRLSQEVGRRNGDRGSGLTVEVVDYGAGLPESVLGQGMGLRIMRYRAEMAGADLRIERLETGTRVCCSVGFGQGAG